MNTEHVLGKKLMKALFDHFKNFIMRMALTCILCILIFCDAPVQGGHNLMEGKNQNKVDMYLPQGNYKIPILDEPLPQSMFQFKIKMYGNEIRRKFVKT